MTKTRAAVLLLVVALSNVATAGNRMMSCSSKTKKYKVTVNLGSSPSAPSAAGVAIDQVTPQHGALVCEKRAAGRVVFCATSGPDNRGYEARLTDMGGPFLGTVWRRSDRGKEKLANLFCSPGA